MEMQKFMLLNDGCFSFLEDVNFPVMVMGVFDESDNMVGVPTSELQKLDNVTALDDQEDLDYLWWFQLGDEIQFTN